MNYYNEFDPGAAAWLRELIDAGHIPQGYVDDRSITEVTASDLAGFTQCHFFAGIGGWSYALRLAGVPASTKLWTGSPPCQPFSVAGKQLGQLDDRHLAPTFMRLVDQCRPPVLFGEQVAAAISKHWLDDLFVELERQGYACGSAVLPACSVGAPHKRDRLFFGAMAYESRSGRREEHKNTDRGTEGSGAKGRASRPGDSGRDNRLGDTSHNGINRRGDVRKEGWDEHPNNGAASGMADADHQRQEGQRAEDNSQRREGQDVRQAGLCDGTGFTAESTNPHNGFWSDADWLGCRDGKFRPVKSGTFPLANGVPARVGRLRGYGNAIVPQVAAEFIKAFYGAVEDARK